MARADLVKARTAVHPGRGPGAVGGAGAVTDNDGAAQATREDICRGLREHYERISMAQCDWSSGVGHAISAYEREPDLQAQLATAEARVEAMRGVVEAARVLQNVPAVLIVAEETVDFLDGTTEAVPVTQDYVNEVWNQFIDALDALAAEPGVGG